MKKLLIIIIIILGILIPNLYIKSTVKVNHIVYMASNNQSKTKSIFSNNELEINKKDINSEDEFVEYLKDVLNEIKKTISKKNLTETDKELLKNTFIDFADFIFYDKEIKGYKFRELSITSKKSVIKYFQTIDNEIEKVFPKYKKSIKKISNKTYSNLKKKADKLLEKYANEIKTTVENKVKKSSKSIFSKIKNAIKKAVVK